MPATFEEFQAELAKRQGGTPTPLDADTASLKQQFAGPQETMGQAVKADTGGLAGMDFTNPSNLPNVLHHGVPILLQMLGTGLGGQVGGRLGQMLGSGLGSAAGYGYQSAAEPAMQGQSPTTTLRGLLMSGGIGGVTEGAAQMGGALNRYALSKNAALAGGEAAANEVAGKELAAKQGASDAAAAQAQKFGFAEQDAQAAGQAQAQRLKDLTQAATEKAASQAERGASSVQTARAAVDREVLKHSEDAFQGVQEAEVERMVREGLGPRAIVQEPVTLASLTADTTPVKNIARDAIGSVFRGVSDKFNTTLAPYRDIPVPDTTLGSTITTIQRDIERSGESLTPGMLKLMDEAGGQSESLSMKEDLARRFPEQAQRVMDSTVPMGGGSDFGGPPTVDQLVGWRNRFSEIVQGGGKPVDRRTAFSVIDAIDSDIAKVMPQEAQAALTQNRAEWLQARSTFSGAMRSRLFHAEGPDQVAEAIYTGAKTGKAMGNRAALLVNQVATESPEQLPTLRQAFTSMITNHPDATNEVLRMDPRVMRVLYRGTGFENPQAWVEAQRGQITMQSIARDPVLMAQYNSAFQQGMGSFGTRAKQAALQEAESAVKSVPSQQDLITKALADEPTPQAVQQETLYKKLRGQKTPDEVRSDYLTKNLPAEGQEGARYRGTLEAADPWGGGFIRYVTHRTVFHTLLGMGAMAATHNPMSLGIPIAFLASAKGMSAALANPTLGRLYYNAVTSKTLEQMAFWAGRLTAAGLTEGVRPKQ